MTKRYFIGCFEELERLPDEALLLVRAKGLMWVEMIRDALDKNDIYYYTAAERKDDVEFYVQEQERTRIEDIVRKNCSEKE